MDKKYLIDTNILIYYFDNKIPKNHINKIELILLSSFNISTITKIELLGWNKLNELMKVKISNFLQNATTYYIDDIIEKNTIKLKQNNNVSLPDAVIASTAILNNFTLVTRNTKDFNKIENLNIYNPFE